MDYEWLIANIKKVSCGLREDGAPKCAAICENAADAIETLLVERDAAVEDLRRQCGKCKYSGVLYRDFPCCRCVVTGGTSDYWQWRGPQKDGGGT